MQTERLILRPWKKSDFEPFANLNADKQVMEFFPSILSREESDAQAKKFMSHFEKQGWGLFAVEVPSVAPFIGFIGLNPVTFKAPFTPAIEIGWRLAYPYWGNGYATEGAKAVIDYGFHTLGLKEIVSFTSTVNIRSQKLMQRLGMTHDPQGDFEHPSIPEGHGLRLHVLYKIRPCK